MAALVPLLLSACTQAPAANPEPSTHPTIVSLNPCSDAMLAEVADPAQLLAISSYSHNPASSSMDLTKARQFRAVSGSLEEVIELKPDLVIADQFLPASMASALQQLGIQVARLPIASSVEESKAQVLQLAALAGRPEKGRALIARIDTALARAVPPQGAVSIAAVVWQSGGIVPGPNSLIGDLLHRTGFRHISAAKGMKQADVLPLEAVLADPPEVILAVGNALGNEDRLLSHPALAGLKDTRREKLASQLLWCGGPTIVRAAERLAEVRRYVSVKAVESAKTSTQSVTLNSFQGPSSRKLGAPPLGTSREAWRAKATSDREEKWTLKQVQGDDVGIEWKVRRDL